MEDIKNLKKINVGIHFPKQEKKGRGNPNKYFVIPQKGEPTEYNTEIVYCHNCKKETQFINIFVKDPLQPEDVGINGEKIEPYWIEVCSKCKYPREGISVIKNG